MADNQVALRNEVSTDNRERHRVLFPDYDPYCPSCNIDFLESYDQDLGKWIAFYPFPIEFYTYDACGEEPNQAYRQWLSNAQTENPGPVYLPGLDLRDYQHPNAKSLMLDGAARVLADQLRQTILAEFP